MADRVIARMTEEMPHLGRDSRYTLEIERSAAGPPGLLIEIGFTHQGVEETSYCVNVPDGVKLLTPVVEWLNEWEYNDLEVVHRSKIDIRQMKITWQQLVVLRDLALEHNDFERAVGYSHMIDDIATMIKAMGFTIPDIPS